ncbi:MAG TPA: histidinol-phosphate transaminase, partial [Rhizomicrobium sp.]
MTPSPKPGILDITPYVGGRAAVPGVKDVIKLSSNETPLGPSAKTVEALAKASHDLHIYPEGSAQILREAIGEVHGLDPARIVASGEGSDSILTMLANAYLRPGDEVLFSEHDFIVYKIATLANSAKPVEIPDPDLRFDVDAALARVTDKTRILFIANPNNPTGSYISHQEMRRLHAGLPAHALLVIDAAYSEYVRKNDYEAGIEMVSNYPNVVMTRTFSKIYGLAGMRIGWTYAPAAVCDVLNRI